MKEKLETLHKTIMAAARAPNDALTRGRMSQRDMAVTVQLLRDATRMAEELLGV